MSKFYLLELIFVLILFLFQSNESLYSQSLEHDLVLSKTDDYTIRISEDQHLGNPTSLRVYNSRLLWGEQTRAHIFDRKGEPLQTIEFEGRGPGEMLAGMDYQIFNEGKVAILDDQQYKIAVFDSSFNYLGDFPIRNIRANQIEVQDESTFFTFNDLIYQRAEAAVTQFNNQGKKLNEWGKTPEYALLQDVRNGGGITSDNEENIYYSYLGGHKVWKFNINSSEVEVFDHKPDYFIEASRDKISSLGTDLREIINYSFQVSRVSGLFFVKLNYIIQQIDTGNPWEGEETRIYLEIWDTKGNKLASELEIPHWIADVEGSKIYVLTDTATNLISELDKNKTVKIFDIYKLVRK